jgi:hypothetical protein
MSTRPNRVPKVLRVRAAIHELRCWECRVTWRSWIRRLIGDSRGYAPLGACTCAEPLRVGAIPEPCRLHGWSGVRP